MNTLDRVIRIIYKDMPLFEILNEKLHYYKSPKNRGKDLEVFNLNNESFLNSFKKNYLNIYPNNYNSDEIEYIIEEIIFKLEHRYIKEDGDNCNSIKLFLYIVEKLLFINSDEVKVSFDDLLELNGFINKIDGNILFAAKLALENRGVNKYDKFRILHDNNRLSNILSRGISENHMHLKGSGYTAEMNWYEFSNMKEMECKEFNKIIGSRDGEENLSERISFYKIRFIKFYLFGKIKGLEENFSREIMGELLTYLSIESYYIFFQTNKSILYNLQESFLHEYSCFTNSAKRYFLIERLFLKELFDFYLAGKMDNLTLYLFNIYLLATSKFKMLFYQDNIGMGFEKFKENEENKTRLLRGYPDTDIYETVFDKYYEEKCVKKIEFRVTPKKSIEDYKKLFDELEFADKKIRKELDIQEGNEIKYGLVLHYIKNNKEFDYRENISRKEKTYYELEKQCNALVSFFDQYESIRKKLPYINCEDKKYREKIVGIDTANYEFNFRPEIFGYIYRKQRKEIYSNHKLKFTYHVGEDFTTLADGLRAIDEVIEFLNFGRGDRLGHALALGLDVDKYFETKRYKITQNIESYIDDIVWMRYLINTDDIEELNSLVEGQIYTASDIVKFLEDEFYKWFKRYNLSEYTIYDYYCAYRLRGDLPSVYADIHDIYTEKINGNHNEDSFYKKIIIKYSEKLNIHSPNHREYFLNAKGRDLFFKYHYSQSYKEKHNEILNEEAKDIYIKAVKMAQLTLRKKIYNMEIGIESNPTSNKKISFISKYIDLPFINFNKKHLMADSKYNLPTSINTDDSGIFQTDLSLEYAYVTATLKREGFDIENIYEYIDYIREISMDQSFVIDNISKF